MNYHMCYGHTTPRLGDQLERPPFLWHKGSHPPGDRIPNDEN